MEQPKSPEELCLWFLEQNYDRCEGAKMKALDFANAILAYDIESKSNILIEKNKRYGKVKIYDILRKMNFMTSVRTTKNSCAQIEGWRTKVALST